MLKRITSAIKKAWAFLGNPKTMLFVDGMILSSSLDALTDGRYIWAVIGFVVVLICAPRNWRKLSVKSPY